MTVETNANFISDLNESYPTQRDLINEGDDHIRLVKAVLKKTFPGMDQAITITSEKLNQMDASVDFGDDGVVTIANSLAIKEGNTFDVGGAIISSVGDPKEGGDAVNLQSLQNNLMWPVGSIYLTIDARDPRDIFGFGTWERFAEGRVIIGSGTTTDTNNNSYAIVNESKGGEWLHTITAEELPAHKHGIENASVTSAGGHKHGFPAGGGSDGSGGRRAIAIDIGVNDAYDWSGDTEGGKPAVNLSGDHTHNVTLDITNTGGGVKMPNAQPYMACNIWKRTA